MAIESSEFQERIQKATTGLAGRLAEVYRRTCPTDGVALRDGKCPVCSRQIQPAGPDTSTLSEQAAKTIAFWTRRLKSDKPREREKALTEIRKLDPTFTPAETPKTLTERVGKFFTDDVRIGPDGQRIVTKKLVEMG
jgi:DNA repair exonuclease SbcCD ATPase subunit